MKSGSESQVAKPCYSSSVKKVVTAAIVLLIIEVNMIAIYTYNMVDNSDLRDTPKKEDVVVRVKRVDFDYFNTVTESTLTTIIATVKQSLHLGNNEMVSSGDGPGDKDISEPIDKLHKVKPLTVNTANHKKPSQNKATSVKGNRVSNVTKPVKGNRVSNVTKPVVKGNRISNVTKPIVKGNRMSNVNKPVVKKSSNVSTSNNHGRKILDSVHASRSQDELHAEKQSKLHYTSVSKNKTSYVLPSFFIIGAKVSGVDILSQLLSLHPQIKLTDYSADEQDVYQSIHSGQKLVAVNDSLFSLPSAPANLKKMQPNAKLVLILRDPLERTVVDFLSMQEGSGYHSYEGSFVTGDGTVINEKSSIIRDSLYDVHLKNWLKYFAFPTYLFIDFFQLMTQPYAMMTKVEKFLHIQSFYHKTSFVYKKDVLCTKTKQKPICLTQTHNELNLPTEIDEALKAYYTQHMEKFWSIVSDDLSVTDLVSLIN